MADPIRNHHSRPLPAPKRNNSAPVSARPPYRRKGPGRNPKPRLQLKWADTILPEQWKIYRAAMQALREANVRFLLGGGFALATYIGRWRNTKDIDFYIFHDDRDRAVEALTRAGFHDYFDQLSYDRKWIYRSTRDGVIVDLIWAMANQRAQVDELWFDAAPPAAIRDELLNVVPMEEFMWCKLYILQRDHCDWTDIMNLLYATGKRMDWDRLLWRLEEDWPLLSAILSLYGWLCPKQAALLPESVRRKVKAVPPRAARPRPWNRIRLLDSRDWFAALLDHHQPLKV